MTQQPIVAIRGVSKQFGAVTAVDNVHLDIGRGEFFSVLGPSGCGKTTVLRMLAGLETPTRGEVFIDGQPMSAIPAHRRPTNMVFQNYAIFPHLNVGRNIAFGLRKSGLSKRDVRDRVERMLALIKLPGYAERTATELSGGERQRVALARALVMRPKVLLLDEPLGALDKNLREQMQLELRALQRSVGITFVFVTHDQEEALTLSDRIAVMANGKVLQVDTPMGLYERPNSRFVAGFIGTTNLFPARVRDGGSGQAVVDAGPLGRIPTEDGSPPGADVAVAIRPEKLEIHLEEPVGDHVVQGRMGPAAYLGDRSHFHVHLPGREEAVAVAVQNKEASAARGASEGQAVWLRFERQSVVLLRGE